MPTTIKTFTPEINELIHEPDVIERIRDQIACILKGETQNQYAIAKDENKNDAEDFNFRIFINNAIPYDTGGDPVTTPLINIMLEKAASMDGNSRVGAQKEKATFVIDCITFGNDGGEEWNEKAAAARAWKTARVIRRILMSEHYTYLGMRGIVGSRLITSIETGAPENGGDALTVVTARITLEVQFLECAISTTGPIIEGIDFSVDPNNGEVSINDD